MPWPEVYPLYAAYAFWRSSIRIRGYDSLSALWPQAIRADFFLKLATEGIAARGGASYARRAAGLSP